MPRSVAIVLEPDFASRLEKLAFRTPVWIVDTPENRAAAEQAWHASVEWPHITVTLFRPPASRPTREDWLALFGQIGAFDSVEVIGSALTPSARAALVDLGFERFDDGGTRFRAVRPRRP
jgi:hypothetical protein